MLKYLTLVTIKRFFIAWIISLSCFQQTLFAQAKFGNEWIDFNQPYYKISVAQDGIYRLGHSDLQNAGISQVDPRQFRLYHRGVEQAIHIQGESDGVFDAGDYLEFYGKRNDGTQDLFLLTDPTQPTNPYYNLFSDTTAYFLTWSLDGSEAKRMQNIPAQQQGNPQLFHWNEELQLFSEAYSSGQNYLIGTTEEIYDSFYDMGEGWVSDEIKEGSERTINFEITNLYSQNQNLKPSLEIALVGSYRSLNPYQASLEVGNSSGNLRVLPFTFSGLSHQRATFSGEIEPGDIADTGQFFVRIKATKGNVRLAYVKLTYPQNWVLADDSKVFGLASEESANDTTYIQVNNASAGTLVYDLHQVGSPVRIIPQINAGVLQAMVPPFEQGAGFQSPLLITNTFLKPLKIEPVTFQEINPLDYDYLIITHPQLRKAVGGYADIVQAYADYRASEAGGSFKTLAVNIQQLYDQFAYGERTPLAIRRFTRFMYLGSDRQTNYVFLIGKAVSFADGYFNESSPNFLDIRKNPSHAAFDLVPTIGFPPSDNALVSGLADDNKRNPTPDIPIGRIPASNPYQVLAYLNKVIEHDKLAPELWQKTFLHLSGGQTISELTLFKSYIGEFASIAKESPLKAGIIEFNKSSNQVIEITNISEKVNAGIGLMTFFGHGAIDLTDLDIGRVSNDSLGYRNQGKYPLLWTNGCQLGGVFYDTLRVPLSQDWLFTPNRGAIGFIGHSYLGYAEPLRQFSRGFYKLFQDMQYLDKPIGDMIKEDIRRNYIPNSLRNISNAQQMIYQGDPALRLIRTHQPDYQVEQDSLLVTDTKGFPFNLESDSLKISWLVNNAGISDTSAQPFQIEIKHIYPDSSVQIYNISAYAIDFQDTLEIDIPIIEENKLGEGHRFEVSLDADNQVNEYNENNNLADIEIILEKVTPIEQFPALEVKVFPNPSVGLIQIQSEKSTSYRWQILDNLGRHIAEGLQDRTPGVFTINASTWTKGIYVLKLVDQEGKQAVYRVILK